VGVFEHWDRIVAWLTQHAPVTGAVLRRPTGQTALRTLSQKTGLTPPEDLRDWWAVYGGTEHLAFAEVLPPFYTPLGPVAALQSWELKRRFWPTGTGQLDSSAGSPTTGFHPLWLPFAFDGCGDALAVDLRPGVLHGCVVEWDRERGEMDKPEWTSIDEMLDQVATALENGSPVGHCVPAVTAEGRLDWRPA
jgi:cell wall assembly regulator SMI1